MSGIISARAWGKVWAYRSTFLLGLLNTVETAFFAILLSLALGVIFGLMATSGKRYCRSSAESMWRSCRIHRFCFSCVSSTMRWLFPVTVSESCRQVSLHWAYTPEPIWPRWCARASRPSLRDSSRRLCPRDSLMWSGCIILSCHRASRSFCRPKNHFSVLSKSIQPLLHRQPWISKQSKRMAFCNSAPTSLYPLLPLLQMPTDTSLLIASALHKTIALWNIFSYPQSSYHESPFHHRQAQYPCIA